MTKRFEIRLAGTGGQGLLLAGLFLAEAAAIYDGKYVVQTQSYAPFARGGASSSEIVVSDEEIDYPRVIKPHIIVALSQSAYDAYARDIRKDGIIIVDSTAVESFETEAEQHHRTYAVPIADLATKTTGRALAASVVALGIIAGISGVVSSGAIAEAVSKRSPRGTAEMNQRAVEAGLAVASRLKEGVGV